MGASWVLFWKHVACKITQPRGYVPHAWPCVCFLRNLKGLTESPFLLWVISETQGKWDREAGGGKARQACSLAAMTCLPVSLAASFWGSFIFEGTPTRLNLLLERNRWSFVEVEGIHRARPSHFSPRELPPGCGLYSLHPNTQHCLFPPAPPCLDLGLIESLVFLHSWLVILPSLPSWTTAAAFFKGVSFLQIFLARHMPFQIHRNLILE